MIERKLWASELQVKKYFSLDDSGVNRIGRGIYPRILQGDRGMEESIIAKLEAWQPQMAAYLAALPPPSVTMPRHRVGAHLIGGLESNIRYIEQLQPGGIKSVNPDPNVVRRLLNALDPSPRSILNLRDHLLSEQKDAAVADPVGTARRHANFWIAELTTGRFREFGKDPRIVVSGINEPFVQTVEQERGVLAYNIEFITRLGNAGIRALALELSVGWPRNSGWETPVVWDTFRPLEPVINRYNGLLDYRGYWYPTPETAWQWYANRLSQCPLNVPMIMSECGYTRQLVGLPQPWGYIGNIPPPTYAEQIWYVADNADPRILCIMPFTTGFGGPEWANKDTGPAHADILARKHNYVWSEPWPPKVGITPPVEPPSNNNLVIVPKYTGRITGFYGSLYTNSAGNKYAHEGLDISMAEGTPIYAPYDGIVAYSAFDPDGLYGHYVRTYHPALNICAFYAHLKERKVQQGNSIKQGQLLGLSGNTGNSTGPHLHFEIRAMDANGAYQRNHSAHPRARVDPLGWIAGWVAKGGKVEER